MLWLLLINFKSSVCVGSWLLVSQAINENKRNLFHGFSLSKQKKKEAKWKVAWKHALAVRRTSLKSARASDHGKELWSVSVNNKEIISKSKEKQRQLIISIHKCGFCCCYKSMIFIWVSLLVSVIQKSLDKKLWFPFESTWK